MQNRLNRRHFETSRLLLLLFRLMLKFFNSLIQKLDCFNYNLRSKGKVMKCIGPFLLTYFKDGLQTFFEKFHNIYFIYPNDTL